MCALPVLSGAGIDYDEAATRVRTLVDAVSQSLEELPSQCVFRPRSL